MAPPLGAGPVTAVLPIGASLQHGCAPPQWRLLRDGEAAERPALNFSGLTPPICEGFPPC